jgi:hypothetical protein
MSPASDGADRLATLELPLRGLAGEGVDAIVGDALGRVRGVVSVDVMTAAYRVRVRYRPEPGVREAIDAALHALGVGTPHPHGASAADARSSETGGETPRK